MKLLIAILLAIAIGFACGKTNIPLPAPNHWIGVALIAAIFLGYYLSGAKP